MGVREGPGRERGAQPARDHPGGHHDLATGPRDCIRAALPDAGTTAEPAAQRPPVHQPRHRIVSELGEQAGAKVWPHGLRHTAITSAVEAAQENGVTLDEVRQFSRHKNINTLLVYRDRVRDVQGQLASLVARTVEWA